MDAIKEEWEALADEYKNLQAAHVEYLLNLQKVTTAQVKCLKDVKHQHYRLSQIKEKLKKCEKDNDPKNDESQSLAHMKDLLVEITDRRTELLDIQGTLPQEDNGVYLNIVLGKVNVSVLNKEERFRYKDDYEKFKLTLTFVSIAVCFLAILFQTRFIDALFHFLMVWYYCTLTIRESILRINGSKMKGWWVVHHYISAVMSGVLVTWPDGKCYQTFRLQFFYFAFYIIFTTLLRSYYQRGCLYRLRSLGYRDQMDITLEGFHTWMFRGLTFLLPFLFIGYAWQLYNAYTLYNLWQTQKCHEWQVWALAMFFFVVFIGNSMTTLRVVINKWTTKDKPSRRKRLEAKYSMSVSTSSSPVAHGAPPGSLEVPPVQSNEEKVLAGKED